MLKIRQKSFLVFFYLLVLSAIAIFSFAVNAATEATVTATVTAKNIAVTVNDGTVTYGVLGVGTSINTTTSGGQLNDSQNVVNEGNDAQDFDIQGQNSAAWTLVNTTPGANNYMHQFCTTNCDASPSWTAMTISPAALFTSTAAGSTNPVDLQLKTPTSSSSYDAQSVNVTIVASASS